MASHLKPNIQTFKASADLSDYQYHFVQIVVGTEDEVELAGANEKTIGILMNDPDTAGQPAEVAVLGGGGLLVVSETVAALKLLTPTSASHGEVADAAGEWVGAMALNAGVVNDVVEVQILAMHAHASDA